MTILARIAILFVHAHALWPSAPPLKLAAATATAVRAEGGGVDAELLLAISQHESDLEPRAVSYVVHGRRVDVRDWRGQPTTARVTYGFVQAMGTRAEAARELDRDGGMTAGADEVREWVATCRGDISCAMRGHAGGSACALRDECTDNARAFARLFLGNARRLRGHARRAAT